MVTVAEAHRTLRTHFPVAPQGRWNREHCHCGAKLPCHEREREEALSALAPNNK